MEIIKAIVFGIVEGITEWLPISSTGHMILLNQFLSLQVGENPEEFYNFFQVVIQLGAILAVVILFWKKIWPFGIKDNLHPFRKNGVGAWVKTDIFVLWFHIMVSCIPAVIIGLLFDDLCEALFYNYFAVSLALIIFGILFIVIENRNHGRNVRVRNVKAITYRDALIIGGFQVLAAIFPGTSRSGATILGALMIGIARGVAAEYTFFLAIPVMFGASLLKLLKYGLVFSGQQLLVLFVGTLVAFVVSLVVIRFFMGFVKKHNFKVFGWYRIILGALVLGCGFAGII